MKGHVIAESGSISGYTIDTNVLYSGDPNSSEKTFAGLSKYGIGPAFWAGANGSNDVAQNSANFIVYHNGETICKNINAIGGKIGLLSIKPETRELIWSKDTPTEL
jgi:hypothetical protein